MSKETKEKADKIWEHANETPPKNDFEEIVSLSKKAVQTLVNKQPLAVISLNKENGNWIVLVEVLERKAIPDTQDLIGKYQLSFGKNKEFLGYKRIEVRRRGDTGKEFSEEEETK